MSGLRRRVISCHRTGALREIAALANVAVALAAVALTAKELDIVHVGAAAPTRERNNVVVLEFVGVAATSTLPPSRVATAILTRWGMLREWRNAGGAASNSRRVWPTSQTMPAKNAAARPRTATPADGPAEP